MLKRVRRNFLELEEKALNCLTEFVLVLPVILHLALVTGVPVGVCFWRRRWLLVIVLAQDGYAVLDQDVGVYFQIGLIRVECAELTPLFQKISMLWRNSFAIFEPVFFLSSDFLQTFSTPRVAAPFPPSSCSDLVILFSM